MVNKVFLGRLIPVPSLVVRVMYSLPGMGERDTFTSAEFMSCY